MEWIVVAHRAGAEVYEYNSDKRNWKLVKDLPNPDGRKKNSDLIRGEPGMNKGRFINSAPHSMTKEKDAHEAAAEQFSIQLATFLSLKMEQDHGLQLKIVAGSKFLGMLRKQIKRFDLVERIEWVAKNIENIPQQKWPSIIGLQIPPRVDRFNAYYR